MDSPEVQPYLGSRLDLHCVAHIVQLRRLKGGVRPSGVPGLGFFLVFFSVLFFVFVFLIFPFFDRNCGSISLLFFSQKKSCARVAGIHGTFRIHTESVLSLHTAVIASSAYQESPRGVITCIRGSPKVTTECCPCSSLRRDREQHVPDSSNHSLCLIKLLSSSCCGETLEGNQP